MAFERKPFVSFKEGFPAKAEGINFLSHQLICYNYMILNFTK